jgi:hypothetical protein
LLEANPALSSDFYEIDPLGTEPYSVFCDMTTDGGGWTEVTYPADSDAVAAALIGAFGRQMMKCTRSGTEHIISPSFAEWSWTPETFVQVPGTWIVDEVEQECGDDPEATDVECDTWFGVGCGSGAGSNNKLFPGVSGQLECTDRRSAHAQAAFTICGENNYDSWVVFLRAD